MTKKTVDEPLVKKKQTEKEEWKLLARNTYFHIMENKAI